jgi:hypothetical protein
VPDEPSNGELAWRLDDMRKMLQDLVGRAEYSAHQQAIDLRFARLGDDVQDLRRTHETDVGKLHTRIDGQAATMAANRLSWRAIVYTGIIPALLVGAGILVQLWLSGGKH